MIEAKTLPQVVDLGPDEINRCLERNNYGHLGVCRSGKPYVIPMHFAYGKPGIYFFTTEGLKTEIMDDNPAVCLQVEEIRGDKHWQSVIVTGTAERLKTQRERDQAMKLLNSRNPTLAPAWSIRWLDDMVRSNVEAVYRITRETETGRRTLDREEREES